MTPKECCARWCRFVVQGYCHRPRVAVLETKCPETDCPMLSEMRAAFAAEFADKIPMSRELQVLFDRHFERGVAEGRREVNEQTRGASEDAVITKDEERLILLERRVKKLEEIEADSYVTIDAERLNNAEKRIEKLGRHQHLEGIGVTSRPIYRSGGQVVIEEKLDQPGTAQKPMPGSVGP